MAFLRSKITWVLFVVAALAISGISWVNLSSKSSDFSLKADHTAVDVTADSQAVMAVSIASKAGSAPLRFRLAKPVAGITLASSVNDSVGVAVLTIGASASVASGTYPLLISASSGSRTHTLSIQARVVHTPPPFTVTISPSVRTVVSHNKTYYDVTFRPGLPIRPTQLSVTGLPAGVTSSFQLQDWTNQNRYRLNMATTVDVAPGTYLFTVHVTAGTNTGSAQAYLIVTNFVASNFTIAGSGTKPLAPGVASPINLAITNTFYRTLQVTGLHVAITSISNPACTASNFSITQYSGPSPLTVQAHTTRTLSQLGVPSSQFPKVKMLNLRVNQDVCKGVTLNLAYTGAGSGT